MTDFNSVMLTGVVDCETPGTSVEVLPGSGVVGGSVGPELVGPRDVSGSTVDGTASHSSSMVAAPDVTYSKQYSFPVASSLQSHGQKFNKERYSYTWCKHSHQNKNQLQPLRYLVSACRLRSGQRRHRVQFSSDSNFPRV